MNKTIDYQDKKFRAMCRRMVRDNVPDRDFEAMMYMAESKGLDPTARHITTIPKDGQWKILTQIDGFRFIAHSTGEYCGQDNPDFKYDGEGNLISATITVYRWHEASKTKCPYSYTAMYDEFVQFNKKGQVTKTWALGRGGMGHVMLAKCAEANAFRKAFPEMAGLYISEEMDQASNPEVDAPQPTVASGPIEGHGHKIHDDEPPLPEEPGIDERDAANEPPTGDPDVMPDFKETIAGAREAFKQFVARSGADKTGIVTYFESRLEKPLKEAKPAEIIDLVKGHWDTSQEALENGIKVAVANKKEGEKIAKQLESDPPSEDLPQPAQVLTRLVPLVGPENGQFLFGAVKKQFGDITALAGNNEARDWLIALEQMGQDDRINLIKEIAGG